MAPTPLQLTRTTQLVRSRRPRTRSRHGPHCVLTFVSVVIPYAKPRGKRTRVRSTQLHGLFKGISFPLMCRAVWRRQLCLPLRLRAERTANLTLP
jgi:hypothetical protein